MCAHALNISGYKLENGSKPGLNMKFHFTFEVGSKTSVYSTKNGGIQAADARYAAQSLAIHFEMCRHSAIGIRE